MMFGVFFSFLITYGGIVWLLLIFLKSMNISEGSTFKKSKQEFKKEPKIINNENIDKTLSRDEDLGGSLKRLKKMYNDGHLTKVEFEKAKNKLLN